MKKVGIIMGSDSDLPILRKTMDTWLLWGFPMSATSILPTAPRSRLGSSH